MNDPNILKFYLIDHKDNKNSDKTIGKLILGFLFVFISCSIFFGLAENYSLKISMEIISYISVVLLFFSLIFYFGYKVAFAKNFNVSKNFIRFTNKSIEVNILNVLTVYEVESISNIEFLYSGADHFFSPTVFDLPRKMGNRNYINFSINEQNHSYEFYVQNVNQITWFYKVLDTWKAQGIKIQYRKNINK